MPIGVVVRRLPGVTRWAKHSWKAVAVLPGASDAHWQELRRDGDAVEYHAATLSLDLHGAETEAYLHGLSAKDPSIYVIMREGESADPLDVVLVTASPYEAQDYTDSGEELVEKVPMTEGLLAWVQRFVTAHHHEEAFVKRKRDKKRIDITQDGKGDPRIASAADIFASPARQRKRVH
ncbi:DUF3305 domain-containing protein [Nereida sp. MMG025]|uniref:DUF3305 domain-containing protein n=1 Tax=Nereida sp. MMG025 TaxID=2909981 RepID=UPI001F221653|nr:DUF3305 domain-containing protein [Nereida sp. MMG025]MCF6444233.1 DUF3305 domain-containing protein [Nereida sp. MMG025]